MEAFRSEIIGMEENDRVRRVCLELLESAAQLLWESIAERTVGAVAVERKRT